MSMIGATKKALEWEKALERVPYIHYLVQFKKDTSKTQV